MGSRENALSLRVEQAAFSLQPSNIAKVLCHRLKHGREQFLIRWKTEPATPVPPRAICSWHDLSELTRCLHFIQKYIETHKAPSKKSLTLNGHLTPTSQPPSRKRKSPEDNPLSSRDSKLGPPRSHDSRSASVVSIGSSSTGGSGVEETVGIYNGVLEQKAGWIVAKRSKRAKQVNATTLPTAEMLERAAATPLVQAERYIRLAFEKKLSRMKRLRLVNNVDGSTPSLDFTFIDDYIPGKDVYRADPDSFEGCTAPCKPNMGNRIGCEMPRDCKCLEYAAVNEDQLRREDEMRYREYKEKRKNGDYIDITKLPKRFPYHKAKGESQPQTLVQFYREERHVIYECNPNCKCGPVCKSRVVQKGRRVPLVIFKTPNRGWGVYCDEDLIQGEFIDTYLGEIITNEEADRRESTGSKDKQSYLYNLDKFVDEVDDLTADNCYVVDGQKMGGATRFINHSCEPNCQQYTVSYNKNDPRIYDLAFFAIEDIPRGVELTFDYQGKDEIEEDVAVKQREASLRDPANAGKQPCNCGARKCRGFLWD